MNVTIIADASYCHKTGAAGYGFWAASERNRIPGGGEIESSSTNVVAEMLSMTLSVEQSLEIGVAQRGDTILVQNDCQPAIHALSGVRKKNLSNEEYVIVSRFKEYQLTYGLTVHYKWVKGHSTDGAARYVANNMCDKRAKQHMRRARTKIMKEQENG